ncbi:MAG: hypothetical protein KatS3mg087_1156 [Patescibacteria group bacterium]|nr:MAG: hypothetical protein KatS3mg087_1156 [Patescibacteria group bacterium]
MKIEVLVNLVQNFQALRAEHGTESYFFCPTLCLVGSSGTGKTARVLQLAAKLGLNKVIQVFPGTGPEETVLGFPQPEPSTKTYYWADPNWAAEASDQPALLFLDEIDKAALKEERVTGLCPLLAQRITPSGRALHKETIVITAGQPIDRQLFLSTEAGQALAGRLCFLYLEPDWDYADPCDVFGVNELGSLWPARSAYPPAEEMLLSPEDKDGRPQQRAVAFLSHYIRKYGLTETTDLVGYGLVGRHWPTLRRLCEHRPTVNAIAVLDAIARDPMRAWALSPAEARALLELENINRAGAHGFVMLCVRALCGDDTTPEDRLAAGNVITIVGDRANKLNLFGDATVGILSGLIFLTAEIRVQHSVINRSKAAMGLFEIVKQGANEADFEIIKGLFLDSVGSLI